MDKKAAAAAEDETTHQQPLTPRKRGRPRKIVERAGDEEGMEVRDYESKKVKSSEEVEKKEGVKEEETRHEEVDLSKSKIKPSGSRARRKSKPRRSC